MNISSIVSKTVREVFCKIDVARQEKDISWAKVVRQLKSLGINCSENAPYDWKAGRSSSFLNYMPEIAKILDVPKEKLMASSVSSVIKNVNNSINESPNSTLHIGLNSEIKMSKQERELIEMYRDFSLGQQQKFVNYALKIKNNEV